MGEKKWTIKIKYPFTEIHGNKIHGKFLRSAIQFHGVLNHDYKNPCFAGDRPNFLPKKTVFEIKAKKSSSETQNLIPHRWHSGKWPRTRRHAENSTGSKIMAVSNDRNDYSIAIECVVSNTN